MIDQEQIRQAVASILDALGEDIEREGLPQTPRRVKKPGTRMVTSAYRGEFETNSDLRQEFRSMTRRD